MQYAKDKCNVVLYVISLLNDQDLRYRYQADDTAKRESATLLPTSQDLV